ncbi:MAG: glycosyltransferase family 4 protein [Phycisphaerales bacterium]|nr:glycosyltransferase family 4 protein [Phycisphaerales bacterium]
MARVALIGGFGDLVVKLRGSLIRALRDAGHEVAVCVPPPSASARAGVETGLRELGARLVESPLDRTGTNVRSELAARTFYVDFLRRERPDAVLAYNPKPIFHAVPAARRAGVRHVGAMVTGLGYAFTSTDLKARVLATVAMRLYRRALPMAGSVIFQNEDDRRFFEHMGLLAGVRAVHQVPGSGVDLSRFTAAPPADASGVTTFLFAGRLLRDKGLVDFVEAARALRSLRSDESTFRFRVAGMLDSNPSAVTAYELEQWTRGGMIEHLGRLEDVRPALAACSVFVLPSYREGMPMAVLEAMATGRAVVTTDVPGCRETIVDGESGILVPPGAPAALAVALEQFLEDRTLAARMGAAARARAEREFDARSVGARIIRAMGL